MDLTEAHDLNTIAASFDNREPSVASDHAWASALNHLGVEFADARQAVIQHYAVSTNWIMPADVGRIATTIKTERLRAERRELRERERLELEARQGPRPPTRDRTDDLRNLINGLMSRYRNWDPIGDLDMRRRQAHSPNPEARAAADEASRAKARQIVAESRARQHPDPETNQPEPEPTG
jgi:hypothetical protein